LKTAGIIAEFNPFHSGHAYLLDEVRRQSGAEQIVIIMSGDFVQRGEPAVFDKYRRTELALAAGADLVYELPVRFCLSSARDFALGGVFALESLGFVTDLYFGSECGEIEPLMEIADILYKESTEGHDIYSDALKKALKQGFSYPAARAQALSQISSADKSILQEPNNILGIEYCFALQYLHSSIRPHTLQRMGQHYNDSGTPAESKSVSSAGSAHSSQFIHPSASALRRRIYHQHTPHLCIDDFSEIIGYTLLRENNLEKYKDISPDLAGRIQNLSGTYCNVSGFVQECQTRTFTEGRIRRSLFQCVLGLTETEISMPYLRLLGCADMSRLRASFQQQKTTPGAVIPKPKIITRLAADTEKMDKKTLSLFSKDLFASDLYRQVWQQKYNVILPNEYQHCLIKKEN
jgi:predicted nucleotidyltransferase